jgi:DNA (cytosine-5)-methyltransferase 1
LLEAIAAHKASFKTVPVGGFRRQDRVLWALLPDPEPTDVLTVGSLFSGIGGIDLGLERAGMRVVWQSEVDPYCSRVLAKHWPDIPNLGDVKAIDWSQVEPVDLICGGYPCQPFSGAGERLGEDDERHLWPYFADAIRVLRPDWVLLENVPGHLSLGLDRVLGDLAELGFDADWSLVSAASMGAHHRRERLFVVANATGSRLEGAFHAQPNAPERVGWASEPAVGRVADGVPRRVDRLRALGNAVVPQVAEWVGRRIVADAGLGLDHTNTQEQRAAGT